jgi:MOSC domain-containing protein YiiM
MSGRIVSVSRSIRHSFSKQCVDEIVIQAGLGVEGDAHAGVTVRHRYLVKLNPAAPNLCQVHLLQSELFDELRSAGLRVSAGEMGENVTTAGLDLLGLPLGTRLGLGETAVVQVTGLRTPCLQMDRFRPGLQRACLGRNTDGSLARRAGVMAIALVSGTVRPGDSIAVELPPKPWVALGPV